MTIRIREFDHQAMVEDRSGEVCRILRGIADSVSEDGVPNADGMVLMDVNGNRVGTVGVDWEEDDEDEDEPGTWDGDTSDIAEVDGVYGSGHTPCNVVFCKRTLWYVVEGSVNVSRAPHGFWFEDGADVEEIDDVDTMTAGTPVKSFGDLAKLVWEHENG